MKQPNDTKPESDYVLNHYRRGRQIFFYIQQAEKYGANGMHFKRGEPQ